MKVVVGYPPLESTKGYAFLAQNRQFQWGHTPWTAYPMVPAYAASLLKKAGYDVYWLDGIWSGQSYAEWEQQLLEIEPDVLVMETKTPVVKKHWRIIDHLKQSTINNQQLTIVLVGDHVTALPGESMENSKVDYVLTGGDYDFLLLNLCNHLSKGEELEPGIWYRGKRDDASPSISQPVGLKTRNPTGFPRRAAAAGETLRVKKPKPEGLGNAVANTGHFVLNHNLDSLPFVDRNLTKWRLYAYKNSNYCRIPGTYTMFGRDCWWGKCSFCSWTTLYPGVNYRPMSVKRALDEVGFIIENYPIREIMDDSGTFPVGEWLREFCQGMIERGYNKKVRINCNMRFNSGLNREDYQLMREAGFRFLLYGLESVNQKTLDRLNKNLNVEQIKPVLRWAKEAGLNPHITVMIGYPWEAREDAEKTLQIARELFKQGLADSLQATIVMPYPGTPLFNEAKEKGWLTTYDWERYDMREPILKTEMSNEGLLGLVRGFYKSIFSLQFVIRKLKEGLSDWDLFRYYTRFAFKFFSRLRDFSQHDIRRRLGGYFG